MINTSQRGSGTVRRPALCFGYGLDEVCPPTSTTVRITDRWACLRSSASSRRPAASPQRSPAPAAVAMIAVSVGCCREQVAAQVLTADDLVSGAVSAVPCQRRRRSRMPSHGLNAMSRLRTADRSTAEVRRCASATVAGDLWVPSSVIHFCTDRRSIFDSCQVPHRGITWVAMIDVSQALLGSSSLRLSNHCRAWVANSSRPAFFVASEKSAVIILPSANSPMSFDRATVVGEPRAGGGLPHR